MNDHQVIACFVIYLGEEILYQGTFEVEKETKSNSYSSMDGGLFEFTHSYKDSRCFVKVTYTKDAPEILSHSLDIPINKSKIKWKHTSLGGFDVRYRAASGSRSGRSNSRESKKIQRKAAIARAGRKEVEKKPAIFYVDSLEQERDT